MSESVLSFQCRFRYRAGFSLDANFALPPGISAMFGPSGSGKSTCLSLIAGLLRPERGRIQLHETVLVDRARGDWIPPHRRRLGVVFQDHLLFPHKTVRANLCYGMHNQADRRVQLGELVAMLELTDLLDRYPAQLSGGQQRRVALGRALLREPALLLMDEPLAGLDEAMRRRVLDHLQQVYEHWRVPMLLVSHDQAVVRRLARHVVLLEEGRVLAQGPVHETLDRATIQTMATHPGPINLLRIEQVRSAGDHSEGRVGNQPFYLSGRVAEGTVYVRCLPHDVALTLEDVPQISMRNRLRGTIQDMVRAHDADRVFVAVDVGQLLWTELTSTACEQLKLAIGTPVVCLIKATATEAVG